MKILHTADWHIGNFPGPEKDGHNLRTQDTTDCINSLIKTAQAEKPDIIVISGDIFHQARVWADRGLSEVQTAIKALEALAQIPFVSAVVVLRGTPNHDGEEQFKLLAEHFACSNVHIAITPTIYNIDTGTEKIQIACLPGFDRGEYRAKFPGLSREDENLVFSQELGNSVLALRAECEEAYPHILLAHYTVPGCNTESGQTPFLAQFEPVIMPETLDAAGFDLVCLGHIHRPQEVASCRNTYYSGAVNAMNFNDEGQERGFWIHQLDGSRTTGISRRSEFHKTPSRKFQTIRLDKDNISAYNVMGFAGIASLIPDCENSIVRVIYSCTEEEDKAFNRAALEHDLYDIAGVFWVSEITPDNITVGTNKNELSEKNDPEANLTEYLREKAVDEQEIAEIVSLARPIISEVMANDTASRLTGMFVPLEISVKNYRNYAEETFSFKDVTFCTINGKNGAGKSSLFMDAILDALYEEPREGDLTAWIRADEKARSGSISFTFAIGDKIFRVVRTRAKSGKATLNLSEQVDGEWENRSKEKYRDTQEEIVNILGMDSLTFRSCALIMQDQYGLFLQADKEARMSILGNILGLGIYGDMETITRTRLGDCNRKISFAKNDILNLQNRISALGNPREDIEIKENAIKFQEDSKQRLTRERDNVNVLLNTQLEQAKKAESLRESINTLTDKKTALNGKIGEQNSIINTNSALLADETSLAEKLAALDALEEQEKQLTAKKALYDKTLETVKATHADITAYGLAIDSESKKAEDINSQLQRLETKKAEISAYASAAAEYDSKAAELKRLESLEAEYNAALDAFGEKGRELSDFQTTFYSEDAAKSAKIAEYSKKAEILSSCDCIDIDRANCQFLADAKEAAAALEPYRDEYNRWKSDAEEMLNAIKSEKAALWEKLDGIGYDTAKVTELRTQVEKLEQYKQMYAGLDTISTQIEQLKLRKADSDAALANAQERLASAKTKYEQARTELADCKDFEAEYQRITAEISSLKVWSEKEALFPVYRERRLNAQNRKAELENELRDVMKNIADLENERKEIIDNMGDLSGLKSRLADIDGKISETQRNIDAMRTDIGSLTKTLEDIEKTEQEMANLQSSINTESAVAARYEILKHAFSQDGIPHNIIRTIIPILTATSNTILGQMTGGKMGMQFVTDKVLKSNKKEVATLDIVIEEYGKDTLPYLSKSGGEKVKSSLSAILALAEIKSTQAGIQLGMLFIDEPPFLDDEGTQAYCDALETIGHRYKDLKIMAITHDPTFKARFPQNLDVIKTDEGSKVIFE